MNPADTLSAATREIEELHRFFVDWFGGHCEDSDAVFSSGLTDRCDPGFTLIQPGGAGAELSTFAPGMRRAFGSNPDFRIAVRDVGVRLETADLVVATYEEWQRNARNSQPEDNGRISTALFLRDSSRPTGLRWVHVHETWLPDDVMAAGPFDF